MRLIYLYILAVLLTVTTVDAREEFWYLGAGGGVTFLEDKDDFFEEIDKESYTAKAYVGYRASNYVAFELDYAYLGEYDFSFPSSGIEDKAEYSALTASIVVMYPLVLEGIELFTPIGVSVINADYGIDDKVVAGYKLGFGVAYTPTKHFTMRVGAELLVFDIEASDDDYKQHVTSVYATLQYNF